MEIDGQEHELALGALALYELTFDTRWLSRARAPAESTIQWFWDDEAGAFFDTPRDHEELLTRPRDVTDNATPAGSSLAVELLLRLGDLLGDADMARRARFVLESIAEPMARYPLAFGHALTAADMVVFGAVEVALVGRVGNDDLSSLARAASAPFVPSLVLAGGASDDIALLAHRAMRDGRATAYVCRNYACDEPVTDPRALWEQLSRASRAGPA